MKNFAPLPTWSKIVATALAIALVAAGGVAVAQSNSETVDCFQLMITDMAAFEAKCGIGAPPASISDPGSDGQVNYTVTVTAI